MKKAPNGAFFIIGGEGGIRTHGAGEGTTDFESVPIDHSGTSPIYFYSTLATLRVAAQQISLAPSMALTLRAPFGRANRQSCRFVESVPIDHSGTSPNLHELGNL